MHSKAAQSVLVGFVLDGMKSAGSRSLKLLKAIEDTTEVNSVLAHTFSAVASGIGDLANKIYETDGEKRVALDATGKHQVSLETTSRTLAEIFNLLSEKRKFAASDRRITAEDGLVESFDEALHAVEEAFDCLQDLKWALMENDAEVSSTSNSGPFTDIDDLFESLGK